ncbi:MAG: hypothetical protein J7J11_00810 [Desulfurococcales archaeon]|nr:hypothetical protein [Desulfurococcales archaeon]
MSIEMCPTGIDELDELLNGGFPRGDIILVAGHPGAGKTTLSAKFIYEGAKRFKEPGVYLSFLEPKNDFYRFMRALGMDFEELERRGLVHYIEGIQTSTFEGIEDALKEFMDAIVKMNAKRVVMDSATAITQVAGFRLTRELIKNAMVNGLKPLGITGILISELPIGAPSVGYGVEEFLVDGVIILKSTIENGVLVRKMEIRKMRGTSIPYAELYFDIAPGVGIKVYLPPRMEEIPAPSEAQIYIPHAKEIRFLCGGYLRKGSQIAFIVREPASVLPLLIWWVLGYIARYGGTLLIRTYSKPPQLIRQAVKAHAKKFNVELSRIIIDSINPTAKPLYVMSQYNRESDTRINPTFLVFDSLQQVPMVHSNDWDDFFRQHLNNLLLRRKLGITSFYIYNVKSSEEIPIPLDIYDLIIKVRPEWRDSRLYLYLEPHPITVSGPVKPLYVQYKEGGEFQIEVVGGQ